MKEDERLVCLYWDGYGMPSEWLVMKAADAPAVSRLVAKYRKWLARSKGGTFLELVEWLIDRRYARRPKGQREVLYFHVQEEAPHGE